MLNIYFRSVHDWIALCLGCWPYGVGQLPASQKLGQT